MLTKVVLYCEFLLFQGIKERRQVLVLGVESCGHPYFQADVSFP